MSNLPPDDLWGDFLGDNDNDFSDESEIQIILDEYGFEDEDEVFINLAVLEDPEVQAELAFSTSNVQGNGFASLSDAIRFLAGIGVLGFSRVTSITDDNGTTIYYPVIPDETP